MGLTIGLLVQGSIALAQPDYPPAHWVPATNCTKYYTTGYGHNFCVIHDMEGYYWSSISYLNRCDISASIHYLVNGLQNGSDSLGHRENNPDDPPAGDITQSVREEHYAWHARCWNRYMFGTEHEGFVSSPVWFSEEMYQASAALHRHLCYTYGIPRDRNHIIGHDEKRSASWVAWMNVNWPEIDPNCNTHTDPGQYWDWSYFMSLIMGPTIIWQPESLAVNPGSNATFSVTATGNGLLTLSQDTPGLRELFSEQEMVYFLELDELIDKLSYYRQHDDEARAIARRGREKAHASFNSQRIARFIKQVAFDQAFTEDYEWAGA